MSNATRSSARAPRPSLSATVVRIAVVALVAAVLLWTLLFADALRKRAAAGTVLAQPAGQLSGADGGQSQAPAPVTTRTS
jgi:hypothetical protein